MKSIVSPSGLIIGVIAVSMSCMAFIGCSREVLTESRATPVRTLRIEPVSQSSVNRYSAVINAISQVDLVFKGGGFVEKISQKTDAKGASRLIAPGDSIRAGEVLAVVRQKDYADILMQAEGQVAQAEAYATRAKSDFERATRLLASASMTLSTWDGAKAANDSALAALESAQGKLSEAKTAQYDSSLRAPFDGVVIKRNIELGALVGPSLPAMVVANISETKAVFGVPDSVVGKLKIGQLVEVRIESINTTLQAKISSISPSADVSSRLFPVEIMLPNPGMTIKPGFIVSIRVDSEPKQVGVVIPLMSIVQTDTSVKSFSVFKAKSRDKKLIAAQCEVVLGEVVGNNINVLKGLEIGDTVVTFGASELKEGDVLVLVP